MLEPFGQFGGELEGDRIVEALQESDQFGRLKIKERVQDQNWPNGSRPARARCNATWHDCKTSACR